MDPSYIKTKKKGKGYIDEAVAKIKMEGIRQRLLVNILKAADYYVDLNETYGNRKKSSTVEEEDERDVINDLAKLLKTKKSTEGERSRGTGLQYTAKTSSNSRRESPTQEDRPTGARKRKTTTGK